LFLVSWPILIIFVLVFFRGEVFTQPDVVNYYYPTVFSYGQAIKNNLNPFWDPLTLSGFPAFIFSGQFFSPVSFIFFGFFYFLTAFHWLLAANLILAGFFTIRLIKRLGASKSASIVGGLAYVISLEAAMGIDLPLVSAGPILPLLFLILLADFKRNRWWLVVLGGLLIGFAGLAVHVNWLVIILTGGFLFSLGLGWLNQATGWRGRLKAPIRYLIMGIIGGAIGLIQFLPMIVFTPLNYRWGGMAYRLSLSESVKPFDLASFIFPSFGLPFFTSFPFLYFGIAPLIFLIAAIFIKSRPARFFLLLFAFCFLLAIWYSPLFWLLKKLPVFEYLRAPSRWLFLGFFAASVSAAFGADGFLASSDKIKKAIMAVWGWLIIIITALSLTINVISYFFGKQILAFIKDYFNSRIYLKTTGLPLEHYHQVIDDLFKQMINLFSFFNPHFLWPFASLAVSYFVIKYFHKNKNRAGYFLPAMVVLVGLNFAATFPFNTPMLSVVNRSVFNYKPQTAQFILKNPGRIFSFLPGFTEYEQLTVPYKPNQEEIFIFESELLAPKRNNFYNIPSADGFDSMMPKKYGAVIASIGSDRAVASERLVDLKIPLADKIKLFQERHNLLDLLGVKYVISGYNLENKDLKKVFETKATKYQIPIYVYENVDYLPLFFLAKNVKYINPADDNYKIITDNKNNFNEVTFIECSDCKTAGRGEGEIKAIEYSSGYLKLKTRLMADAWLVFNESNLPGWEARIDNQKTKIYSANYLFQGIMAPAGEHEIVFQFKYLNTLPFHLNK